MSKVIIERINLVEKESRSKSLYFAPPESNFGRLIILGEIKDFIEGGEEILNLINFFKKKYFKQINKEIEINFENVLKELNKILQFGVLKNKNLLSKTNLLIAVLKDLDIYFTYFGEMEAFFIRKNSLKNLLNLNSPATQKDDVNISNIFSFYISGKLENNDLVLFCTSNLLKYYSLKKIKDDLINLKPKEISKKWNLDLRVNNETISAIILKPIVYQRGEIFAYSFLIALKKRVVFLFKRTYLFLKFILKKENVLKLKEKFKLLSKIQKSLLISSFIFAILFISSIIFISIKEKVKAEFLKTKDILNEIETKKEESKNALIYKDEKKAKEKLKEVLVLIDKLPRGFREEESKKISPLLNNLLKLEIIDKPRVLINFDFSPNNVILSENNLYTLNPLTNEIFKFNLKENKLTKEVKIEKIKEIKFFDLMGKEILFFSSNDLLKFNPKEKKFTSLKIESKKEQIKDFKIYEDKIYLLSPKNNQIYRYEKIKEKFEKEIAWLKDSLDLKDVNSFAVDGLVYLLKGKEILKFYKGKKIDFFFEIEPELKNPIKIFTNKDLKNLYIIENNRLIILDKDGKIKKQFKSEEFGDLKNLAVNKEENKIFLLDGNKIFEIAL